MAWPDRAESQLSNGHYEDLVGQIIVGTEGVFAPTIIVDCSGGLRAMGTGDAGIERPGPDEDLVP